MIEVPNHDDIRAGLDGKLYSPAGNVLKEYTNDDGFKEIRA